MATLERLECEDRLAEYGLHTWAMRRKKPASRQRDVEAKIPRNRALRQRRKTYVENSTVILAGRSELTCNTSHSIDRSNVYV